MIVEKDKFYRQRGGGVVGPAKEHGTGQWDLCGWCFRSDGSYLDSIREYDLINEVTVTDLLPFPLKAGGKYCTVKPDGTAGPVVELVRSCAAAIHVFFLPFYVSETNATIYVSHAGDCYMIHGEPNIVYRITAEYVEPKPPTLSERLNQAIALFSHPHNDEAALALVVGVAAELKAAEAKS